MDLIQKAKEFAIKSHGNQMYGTEPYKNHLQEVVNVAKLFGGSESEIVACWLHDTIEDTGITRSEIGKEFGMDIANIVWCVSNDTDYKSDDKASTLVKIASNRKAVFVKLCDRIANVSRSGKIDKYKREQPAFKKALYKKGEYDSMWAKLDSLFK